MSELDMIIAKLRSGGNLGSKVRNPKACLLCSAPKAIAEYEAIYLKTGRWVVDNIKKIKNLTVMDRKNIITYSCPDCGAERPDEALGYKYEFHWVTCKRCNSKHLSPVLDKCINCDEEAQERLKEIELAEGE